MKKLINQRNFIFNPKLHSQKFTEETLTVPNDSYTIQEILERFTRGVTPDISRDGEYPEYDPDFDDEVIQINDLSDIDEARDWLNEFNHKQKLLKDKVKELEKTSKEENKKID